MSIALGIPRKKSRWDWTSIRSGDDDDDGGAGGGGGPVGSLVGRR